MLRLWTWTADYETVNPHLVTADFNADTPQDVTEQMA